MQIELLAVVSVVIPATAALSVFVGYLGGRSHGRVQGLRKAMDIADNTQSIRNARAFLFDAFRKEGGDL